MNTTNRLHSTSLRLCALAFAAFGAVAACETDPKTTTGSGLPKDKALSSLTDSERTTFCSANASTVKAGLPADFGCRFAGAFAAALSMPATDAEVKSVCQKAYDDCQKQPTQPPTGMMGMMGGSCTVPTTCTANVGEAEACVAEELALLKMLPTCAQLTKADINTMGPDPEEGPACKVLTMKCAGAKLAGS